ncbi:GNAT family N-acetyltransferase [Patescibacteria group bacterium]
MNTEIIKSFTTKKDHEAVIRPVRISDLKVLHKYANDLIKEDTYILLSGKPLSLKEETKYLKDCIKSVKEKKLIHLIIEVDGEFAGSFQVRRFDKRKLHVGEIGISLAPKFRDEGLGTECLNTLIGEAKKMGLKLLTLTCFSINSRAIKVYQKVGFKIAGIIPDVYKYKGKFEEETIMYLPLDK